MDQYCENKTVINMADMGVTKFNAHKYFSQVPVDGVCIFGTESPDTIVGTVKDDVIFGFGGRVKDACERECVCLGYRRVLAIVCWRRIRPH